MSLSTSFPRSATRSEIIPSFSAIFSVNVGIFPPPPTTNTALTDLSAFNSFIFSAISVVMSSMTFSTILRTSCGSIEWEIPIISS